MNYFFSSFIFGMHSISHLTKEEPLKFEEQNTFNYDVRINLYFYIFFIGRGKKFGMQVGILLAPAAPFFLLSRTIRIFFVKKKGKNIYIYAKSKNRRIKLIIIFLLLRKSSLYLSFPISGDQFFSRSLQSTPFQNPQGYCYTRMRRSRTTLLLSNCVQEE